MLKNPNFMCTRVFGGQVCDIRVRLRKKNGLFFGVLRAIFLYLTMNRNNLVHESLRNFRAYEIRLPAAPASPRRPFEKGEHKKGIFLID